MAFSRRFTSVIRFLLLICSVSGFLPSSHLINRHADSVKKRRAITFEIAKAVNLSTCWVATRPTLNKRLYLSSDDDYESKSSLSDTSRGQFPVALGIFGVAFLYWYLLVFGAAADASGLPVPGWLPLAPGWPPSDADLAPALEDSAHFFYIQDFVSSSNGDVVAMAGSDATPPVVRLAVFNFAEAWAFAFLPVLLADKRRLPLPVVFFTWSGSLLLTNAFLAPYLGCRELFAAFDRSDGKTADERNNERNVVLSVVTGVIVVSVVTYAGASCASGASLRDWSDFLKLAAEDRTYLAFCVDLVLFSVFQSFLLRRVTVSAQGETEDIPAVYNIPFVGIVSWLFGA